MLILSRKPNEKIVIGSDITVTVIDIRGQRVRLGFESESHIPIDRLEIREAKDANRE